MSVFADRYVYELRDRIAALEAQRDELLGALGVSRAEHVAGFRALISDMPESMMKPVAQIDAAIKKAKETQ